VQGDEAQESGSDQKWKQLAELATSQAKFELAQQCLHEAQDHGGILLLATAAGNAEMVRKLGSRIKSALWIQEKPGRGPGPGIGASG
jgi:coatomer subunit beta'